MEIQPIHSRPSCRYQIYHDSTVTAKPQSLPLQIILSNNLTSKDQGYYQNINLLNSLQEQPSNAITSVLNIFSTENPDLTTISSNTTEPIQAIYDSQNRISRLSSLDTTLDYSFAYVDNLTIVTNNITGEVHLQELDQQGRLIREVFPCGLEISWEFDGENLSQVNLPDESKVHYTYNDQHQILIQRIAASGRLQYQHQYDILNDGTLQEALIGDAGAVQRIYNKESMTLTTVTNSLEVINQYDEEQHLISRTIKNLNIEGNTSVTEYSADNLLAHEKRELDSSGRVILYNGFKCSYDEDGRLVKKESSQGITNYEYDALDRMTSVIMGSTKIDYTYDPTGRRLSKTLTRNGEVHKEFYLYQGLNQIGVYNEHNEPIYLRVLGTCFHKYLPFSISMESQDKTYATVYSSNLNTLELIDKDSGQSIQYDSLKPFGDNLKDLNPVSPWIFATKYFDSDTGLFDFGERQYDPSIKQWTSKDADPRITSNHLYSYCNCNPMNYIDPNGLFSISFAIRLGARAGAGGGILGALTGAAIGAVVGLAATAIQKKVDEKMNNSHPKDQFEDAIKEIERKTGKKITKSKRRELHDYITGQGYGYHDIVEEGVHLFL